MTTLLVITIYFALIFLHGRLTAGRRGNDGFFRAGRRSPWYVVAFGMIGASISGVTFVGVPGMVNSASMTYMQMCLGFVAGYAVVAFVLLPVYYRLDLTTIYGLLLKRLGPAAYRTGAWFFLASKMAGAGVKFYVVCMILQRFVLAPWGVPFPLTAGALVFFIWLYTRRGGMRTIVWTDALQTAVMLLALCFIIYKVTGELGMSPAAAAKAVASDPRSRWFVFDDPVSTRYFWKQFLSGAFVVVVMTGLDQDVMQKNLTCKSLREAQMDMCSYGVAFVPVNLLFLSLGVLLSLLAAKEGMAPPAGDALLPAFAATGRLGQGVAALFTLGIVAASCSTADSAMTAMTTSFCVDICGRESDETLRRRAHFAVAAVFALVTVAVGKAGSESVIDTVYTLCGYTYGPLLGLFAFALFTKRTPEGRYVPLTAVFSPVLCYAADALCSRYAGYKFGYELLMLNGLVTFAGLWLISKKETPGGRSV